MMGRCEERAAAGGTDAQRSEPETKKRLVPSLSTEAFDCSHCLLCCRSPLVAQVKHPFGVTWLMTSHDRRA